MKAGEIEQSPALRGLGALLCLYAFLSFANWPVDLSFSHEAHQWNTALPWPLLQGQPAWIGLVPALWMRVYFQIQTLLAAGCMGLFLVGPRLHWALIGLAWLTCNKLFFYLLDLRQVANFHHMHLYFSLCFLLASPRIPWLRVLLAVVYLMAAVVKFTPSWLQGEYFASLPQGLPLISRDPQMIQLACQAVTLLELLGPLLFFAPWLRVRQAAIAAFFLFHLYSGVIVGIWYTALMIPFLLLLFRDGFDQPLRIRDLKLGQHRLPALALLGLALSGIWAWIIPGDVRHSGEGRYLGLFMFDANHRSQAQLTVVKESERWDIEIGWDWPNRDNGQPCRIRIVRNGQPQPLEMQAWNGKVFFHPAYFRSLSTRVQNDPYAYWYWARQVQSRIQPEQLAVRLTSFLDGHEQGRTTVDLADFPSEAPGYNPWWRNGWIHPQGRNP